MAARPSNRTQLDAIERRLTGPKRIAVFGHRAVGKTTLLAMFYREASVGRVPGVRLSAVDPRGAEYLADKIARIEAGESPAGTLAETDLTLRLYRGPARIDLVVKDYQGEHVALGSDASILDFFADCEAVLLCLEAEASSDSATRRRRQQEVEHLLERYIGRSDDTTVGRPVALLMTKYEQVVARGGPPADRVEEWVEARFGMTRYALDHHAPRSAIFAVSSYGPEATADGVPPEHLEPMGLDAPLLWLVEALEATDREWLDWLWDLAPHDTARLKRCVKAFEQRYPNSPRVIDDYRRLKRIRRRRLFGGVMKLAAAVVLIVAGLAGYDAFGYHLALRYERSGHAPAEVAKRWEDFLAWHPTQPLFWPGESRAARERLRGSKLETAKLRARSGATDSEAIRAELAALKDEAPERTEEILEVESEIARQEAEQRWKAIRAEALLPSLPPERRLAMIQDYLQDQPDAAHVEAAVELAGRIQEEIDAQRVEQDRERIDAWLLEVRVPDPDYLGLIEEARAFRSERPNSPLRSEVDALLDEWIAQLDRRDFERARLYEQTAPRRNYDEMIRRYNEYLLAHTDGGAHVEEAKEAIRRIEARRDEDLYRAAYEHYVAHPKDVATVTRKLRAYLSASPDGQHAEAAERFLNWYESITRTGEYRVTLVKGAVDPSITKRMAGGAPDLGVTIWVGGREYGPSPVIPDSAEPIWNYTFAEPIRWKYGDDVVIRLTDHDWGDSVVATLRSGDDPLAIQALNGTVRPSKTKGRAELVFRSDFKTPKLPKPGRVDSSEGE